MKAWLASLVNSIRYSELDLAERDHKAYELSTLLTELWSQKWTLSHEDPFPDPTIRFIIHTQVKADGSLKEPKEVTGVLAKLTYIMVHFYTLSLA